MGELYSIKLLSTQFERHDPVGLSNECGITQSQKQCYQMSKLVHCLQATYSLNSALLDLSFITIFRIFTEISAAASGTQSFIAKHQIKNPVVKNFQM